MSDFMVSKNNVIHRVVSDDGSRLVLENPSGSKITVTKSRGKFRPMSHMTDRQWKEIVWAIFGFRVAQKNNHSTISDALRDIAVLLHKGERVRITVEKETEH